MLTCITVGIMCRGLQAMELVTSFQNAVITGNFDSAKELIGKEGKKQPIEDGQETPLHVLLRLSAEDVVQESHLRSLTRLILPYAGQYWYTKNKNDLLPLDLFYPTKQHYCISDLIITTLYTYLEGVHNKNSVHQWPREESQKKQYALIKTFFSSYKRKTSKKSDLAAFINRLDCDALDRYLRYSPEPAYDVSTQRTPLHLLMLRDLETQECDTFLRMFRLIMPRMTYGQLTSQDCMGKRPLDYFDPDGKHASIKNEIIDVCYEYIHKKFTPSNLDTDIQFMGATKDEIVYQLLGIHT